MAVSGERGGGGSEGGECHSVLMSFKFLPIDLCKAQHSCVDCDLSLSTESLVLMRCISNITINFI